MNSKTLWILAGVVGLGLLGCNPATDRSELPAPAEIEKARQQSAAAVDQRTDLTEEQKAGLKRHYGAAATDQRGEAPR